MMDPDDGTADPLGDNASRTTQDPPASVVDDEESPLAPPLRGAPPGRPRSSAASCPPRPSWADSRNIYGDTDGDDDDSRRSGESDGGSLNGGDDGDETLASLATMDASAFGRLRRHRRAARGQCASDSTEETRNRRHREDGAGGSSHRRRRRSGNDAADGDSSFNTCSQHSTSPGGRDNDRRSKRSRPPSSPFGRALHPIPWRAILLFSLGVLLMAKMGVVELKLERSQGRFLRGGESPRPGGEGVVEEVAYSGRKHPPADAGGGKGWAGARSEEGEMRDGGGKAADKTRGEEGGAADDDRPHSPPSDGGDGRETAAASDGEDPPSERYFRTAVEELIRRTDAGGNGDDGSLAAEGVQRQSQQVERLSEEENVDQETLTPEQEQLLLARDGRARQGLVEEQVRLQRQQWGGPVGDGASSGQHAGGLAEWQPGFDHSQVQGSPPRPQLRAQTANDGLDVAGGTQTRDVPEITEQLRNLPLFPQAHSDAHQRFSRPQPQQLQQIQPPPQPQRQPYQYVQQQVPVAGQPLPPATDVIVGRQAHLRGDSSQFAVVGGGFVRAVDADGNVVNDPNAPGNAQQGSGIPVPETNALSPARTGGVDVLGDDPFRNDSRHFRREAPLHLFTAEEKEKLAELEREEQRQQPQPQPQTGQGAPNEIAANAEKPAPPKRSVEDGIADDNPRLWGAN